MRKDWKKICDKCYYKDRYQYKKQVGQISNNSNNCKGKRKIIQGGENLEIEEDEEEKENDGDYMEDDE